MNASSPFCSVSERHFRPAPRGRGTRSRAFTLIELLACPTKPLGRRRSSRAFTLIELLAVIGIVGILLAMAVPGIRGLTRGSNMASALTTLRSTLSMARQYAITQRTTVHVVFPHRTTVALVMMPPSTVADREKALRAYAVCAVIPGTANVEYISDWRYLPSGVLFAPDTASSTAFHTQVNNNKSVFCQTAPYDTRASVRFPDNTGAAMSIHCLTFTPDGSLKRQNIETEIYLNDGSLLVQPVIGSIGVPLYTSSNLWGIVVNQFTGQPGRARDYANFIR